MAFPQHHVRKHYRTQQPQPQLQPQPQPHPQPQPQPQTQPLRNSQRMDVAFFNPTDLPDQSQHPPYIPPFLVAGLAPGNVPLGDGSDGATDFQWKYGYEPERKRLKEQDFLENNSQISSVDFLQPQPVSTGLGLSLDNTRAASTGDSALMSIIGDDIERQLQNHDLEMVQLCKLQDKHFRRAILENVQATQLQTVKIIEDKVLEKLYEKDAEVESINKQNMELENRIEQLSAETSAWQELLRYNENKVAALRFNLQQVHAQSKDSKEGSGDSEVIDTASCCDGRSIDFHLLPKDNNSTKELMKCKACRVNAISMLLLPCKHLCLCKDCESKLSFCPVCQSSKFVGMEVFM